MADLSLDAVRALRKLFDRGIHASLASKALDIHSNTVSKYYHQFKIDYDAERTGDIPELSFVGRDTFHKLVQEAHQRRIPTKVLIQRLLHFIAKDDLYSAVIDDKDKGQQC